MNRRRSANRTGVQNVKRKCLVAKRGLLYHMARMFAPEQNDANINIRLGGRLIKSR